MNLVLGKWTSASLSATGIAHMVSFYYCFDQNDERVETIVLEVNNTPWGETHCYVMDYRNNAERKKPLAFKFNSYAEKMIYFGHKYKYLSILVVHWSKVYACNYE